jgi:hypothetical protein
MNDSAVPEGPLEEFDAGFWTVRDALNACAPAGRQVAMAALFGGFRCDVRGYSAHRGSGEVRCLPFTGATRARRRLISLDTI